MDEKTQELFLALTNRRRGRKDEVLIGVSQRDLQKAFAEDSTMIKERLEELAAYIEPLGLTILSLEMKGEVILAIASVYPSPNELSEDQLGLLGIIFSLAELEEGMKPVNLKALRSTVIEEGYMNPSQFDKEIKQLVSLGYLSRSGNNIEYGVRLLLEYPHEIRKKISAESRFLL